MKFNSYSMKIISYVMFFLFVIAALLQYNDPDPLYWMSIYAVSAIITLLFISTELSWYIPAAATAIAFIGALILGYEALQEGFMASSLETWQMENTAEEKAREAGGIFVIAIWMLLMAVKRRNVQ